MLGPIIMSGLSITPLPQQGRWVARRSYILVDADHCTNSSNTGAACPAQSAQIGGLAENSPLNGVERVAQLIVAPRFVDEVFAEMACRGDVPSAFAAGNYVM